MYVQPNTCMHVTMSLLRKVIYGDQGQRWFDIKIKVQSQFTLG